MVRSASLPIGSGVLASTYLVRSAQARGARPAAPGRPARAAAGPGRRRRAARRHRRHRLQPAVRSWPSATRLSVLTTADLLPCEKRLDGGRAQLVAARVGLPASRVKAMRAGVEVLLLLLDWYGLAVLHVSHEGLRHGMLLAYLERGDDWWR